MSPGIRREIGDDLRWCFRVFLEIDPVEQQRISQCPERPRCLENRGRSVFMAL